MANVSLDNLRIEVSHGSTPDVVAAQLEAFAEDLARNKFSDWGVSIQRDAGALTLVGRRGGTHFDARVTSEPGRVIVALEGTIELGGFKLTLAGGPDGVRRRVRETLERTLSEHLG